jgi:asparagine synthase (glutamine-hydrolysing)
MCGIAGIRTADRPVHREEVIGMLAALEHRGPDGEGVFCDGSFGFGMRRLSIIDPQGGWQPLANESGQVQVVQNGEIYNYRQLRDSLLKLGHVFRTESDTEVIVHAFEHWGGFEFAKRLRGMFAIAVWDRQRHELWLVRDRLGIKPLYFVASPRVFAFASETKALLASSLARPQLEPIALAEYLTYGSAGMRGSLVEGVRQLHPGSVLKVSASDQMQVHRYWELRPEPSTDLDTEPKAREALHAKLHEVVRLHLAADVPVGAFLSGGLDSSAVVAAMAQHLGPGVATFAIGYDDPSESELPFAREVASRWQCSHHERLVTPDALGVVEQIVRHLDEPFADASAIPTWYVAELAAEHVKVVLTGDGGDELFGGYDRYLRARARMILDYVPGSMRRWGARVGSRLPEAFPGKYFLHQAGRDRLGRYASEHCLFPHLLQQRLLRAEWQPGRLGLPDPFDQMLALLRHCEDGGDLLGACMRFDTQHYLPLDILVKVDRMTMGHSLEARPPLLDHELVELASRIPTRLKVVPGRRGRKHIFRQAVRQLLPEAVLTRRDKRGFSLPLRRWFAGPLAGLFRDCVLDGGRCTDYLEARVIRQIFAEHLAGRRDHGLRLWAILILELWLRRQAELRPVPPQVLALR